MQRISFTNKFSTNAPRALQFITDHVTFSSKSTINEKHPYKYLRNFTYNFFPEISVPKSEAFEDGKYTVNCKGPCQNVAIELDVKGDGGDGDLFAR